MDNKLFQKLIITNEFGIHARPAVMIAQAAKDAQSNIWIIKEDEANGYSEEADAKSVLSIISLGCSKGTVIKIKIDDYNDVLVLNKIVKLFKEHSF